MGRWVWCPSPCPCAAVPAARAAATCPPRASWRSRARAPSPSSSAAARRVALVELVHQAPEPVRPDRRLVRAAGDLAEGDDRPPPVVQPHGREDRHLGMRPLEQDLPGHPAGLPADDGEVPAVAHGWLLVRARRRASVPAPPRPPCSSGTPYTGNRIPIGDILLRPAVARLLTAPPGR